MTLLAFAYLIAVSLRIYGSLRSGGSAFGMMIRRQKVPPFQATRAAISAAAGVAWFWGSAQLGSPADATVFALLAAGMFLESARFNSPHAIPRLVDFLSSVFEYITEEVEFFEALDRSSSLLEKGALKAAVHSAISRNLAGDPLENTLAPLRGAGKVLRGLAADVASAGPEPSPALVLALEKARRHAEEVWASGRWRRMWKSYFAAARPWLYPAALGAGSAAVAGSFPMHPALFLHVLASAVLLRASLLTPRWFLRFSAATVLVLMAVSMAVSPPASLPAPLVVKPDSIHSMSLEPRSLARTINTVPDASQGFCRISTGVPGGWVRLRAAPSMDSRTLSYVAEGSFMGLSGADVEGWETGAWRQVHTQDGLEGWIHAPLCPDDSTR